MCPSEAQPVPGERRPLGTGRREAPEDVLLLCSWQMSSSNFFQPRKRKDVQGGLQADSDTHLGPVCFFNTPAKVALSLP